MSLVRYVNIQSDLLSVPTSRYCTVLTNPKVMSLVKCYICGNNMQSVLGSSYANGLGIFNQSTKMLLGKVFLWSG